MGEVDKLREELAAMTAERDALVGAAYVAAEEACTKVINGYDVMKPDGKTYEPIRVQKAAKGMVSLARQDIRALTPSDAITALDHIRAQAKAEGLREAAAIARGIIDGRVYFNERARSDDEAFACAVLAAAQKKAGQ